MIKKRVGIDVFIDKLTNSIEHAVSGDRFKTEVLPFFKHNFKLLKKEDWLFDWKEELEESKRQLFQLVIKDDPKTIQGLISIEDKGDHIFIHLIESAKFNKGIKKLYVGIPGNLVAFVCKMSFEKGYKGFVSFEAKTNLIEHYKKTLLAFVITGKIMAIDTAGSLKLAAKYFPNF